MTACFDLPDDGTGFVPCPEPEPEEPAVPHVLYGIPHQDDDGLGMGGSIRRMIEYGYRVRVMLCTYGANSGARAVTGLDRETFIRARDHEFIGACRAMGVRYEDIIIPENRMEDGAVTVADAQAMLAAQIAREPAGVWVKTYTNKTTPGHHPDHRRIGQAAVNLLNSGVLAPNSLRLFIEPWELADFKDAYPGRGISQDKPTDLDRVRNALDVYGDVDHDGFRYGIGHISTPSYFEMVRPNPVSYYHVPW